MHSLAAAPQAPGVIPPHFFAISITAASVAFVLAMLLKWKRLSRIEFLVPILLLVSGIGFAAAFLTSWVAALGGFTGSVPIFGSVLLKVAAIVLMFIVCYDLYPKHTSNRTTEVAATLLPAFAPQIGGMVGSILGQSLSWVAVAGATILGQTFGV